MGVTFAPPQQQVEESGERASSKTVIACIWAFSTFLWSVFTPPQYTFPARILLLQPFWILRIYFNDDTWVQDLYIVLVIHAGFTLWSGAWTLPDLPALARSIDAETLSVYLRVFSALGGCGLLAGFIVYRGKQLEDEANDNAEPIRTIDENPLPPLLIPSRTTHSRFFPKKHSFSYSYLFVGVPIGVSGRFGSAVSIDSEKKGWFHVDAADHLLRNTSSKRLSDKLSSFLHSQGVKESEWEFAYLVTAPRFLGYNFNPVSFWYIYDEDMSLKYMVPEVNNTFGERRIYLLKPSKTTEPQLNGNKSMIFTQTWDKDFHVSPFNDRQGSYSIRTTDPLATTGKDGPQFDTTIVLRSPEGEPKIIARVFSEGRSLNPATLSIFGLASFISSWWWVGLVTLPRILWEARKLYFKKALDLYFRPEVTKASIGRAFTDDEEKLETFFRAFITDIVEDGRQPLRLIYEPPHADRETVLYSSAFSHQECRKQTLKLKVISPAFFSRFVHYAHAQEAFDRESLATDDQNKTALIEPAGLVPVLLEAMKYRQQRILRTSTPSGPRWRFMTTLRCPPAEASFKTAQDPKYNITDIRHYGPSEMDSYVRLRCDGADIYRRIATKLFLAQRFCFGIPLILAFWDITFRGIIALTAMIMIEQADHFDVLRPRPHTYHDVLPVSTMLLLANLPHLWAFLKG